MQQNLQLKKSKVLFKQAQRNIFENERIDLTLLQLSKSSKTQHRSCRPSTNWKGQSPKKQTFRSFLKQRRSFTPCKERLTFMSLKQQMEQLVSNVQKQDGLELNQFYQLKNAIMLGFLNAFIDDLSRENLDKAQFLVTLFTNMFLLVEKCLQKVCSNWKAKEKNNLKEQLLTHQKYQGVLGDYIRERKEMKAEELRKEKFMKILVAKIREYKKEIKKMEENLRIAAEKLNQFRNGYLEIQIQCINLTMELRNLGEETAKMMVNRKMALALEKSKQYKILKSKKKMKKQIKAEPIIADSSQNVGIKNECFDAFKSVLHEKQQQIPKIASRQIEAILDQQESEPIDFEIFNENLVQNNNLAQEDRVDKETDMQGFFIDMEDKKMGITPQERFYVGMTKMRGVQTMQIEKVVIRTQNVGFQCDSKIIVSHRLSKKRVYDMSFLFENTIKSSNVRMKEQLFLKSIKQIPPQKPKQKRKQKLMQEYNTMLKKFENPDNENRIENRIENRFEIDTTSLHSQVQIIVSENNQNEKSVPYDKSDSIDDNNSLSVQWNGKKKLKKMSSGGALKNKVSFLGSLNDSLKRKDGKKQSLIVLQSSSENEKMKQSIKLKDDSLFQNDLIKVQGTQSIKGIKKSVRNKQNFSLQNRKQITNASEQTNKISKKSLKSLKKYQSSSDFKEMFKTGETNDLEQQQKIKKNNSFHRSQRHLSSTTIRRDFKVNVEQLSRDVFTQMKKFKSSPGKFIVKNYHKVKQLTKMIESVMQIVFKDLQYSGAVKSVLLSAYQAIGNYHGLTNASYIKKKMLSFIREVYQNKHDQSTFQLFLILLGFDGNGDPAPEYSNLNCQLFLKVFKKISTNWKVPFRFDDLRCNEQSVYNGIQEELKSCRFRDTIIVSIMKSVQEASFSNPNNLDFVEVILSFMKSIIKKQFLIINSYQPILSLILGPQSEVSQQFILMILELQFMSKADKLSVSNMLKGFLDKKELLNNLKLNKADFAYFFCQNDILDFPRLLYKALNLFKLKESSEILHSMSVRKLQKLSLRWLSPEFKAIIFDKCSRPSQDSELIQEVVKKNLMILLYLREREGECEYFLENTIGKNLCELYNCYALLNAESSSHLFY